MKMLFEFKCTKCNEVFESLCESSEVDEIERTFRCTKCSSPVLRVWSFGYGKVNGAGFTRKGGIIK